MNGFKIAGKAFCVCEDLREFARAYSGCTVETFLRLLHIEAAEKEQFGGEKR